jgi:hypothetical protein
MARHSWRLINKPENLCAKLERAIEQGLDLLKQGICWTIFIELMHPLPGETLSRV